MSGKTIFMNIPIYNNYSLSFGHLLYIFTYLGEAVGTSLGSVIHFIFGYKLTFCYCSFTIPIFYFITLISKPILLLSTSFILGFFFGILWSTIFRLLSFSASHPNSSTFSTYFQLSNFLSTNIVPLIFSHSLGPNNVTFNLFENKAIYDTFYQFILIKESYELLLIFTIITLLGSTLIIFQPKLWKIVGIKVEKLTNIYYLTLVDYIENKNELQKIVKTLYQQNRKNHFKKWLNDIFLLPFLVIEKYMLFCYIPVITIAFLNTLIFHLIPSSVNNTIQNKSSIDISLTQFILFMALMFGKNISLIYNFIVKTNLTKSHRYKYVIFSIFMVILIFYIIYVEWKNPKNDENYIYLPNTLKIFGNLDEQIENSKRMFIIIFLSFLCGSLEYHIYCYYQLIAREFGLRGMLIPRVMQFLFNAIAMVLFLQIPIIVWLLITMFLTFISAIAFFHAEKYTIKGICITKGINVFSSNLSS